MSGFVRCYSAYADDTAFQQGPKPANGAHVNVAANVFAAAMFDRLVPPLLAYPVVEA